VLRFSANLSILFHEAPLLERFALAREAGFTAVELWWPAEQDLAAVEAGIREAGLQLILLNFDAGDMPAGDRGLLSDPDRRARFRENVPVALELGGRLGCKLFNALAGHRLADLRLEEQLEIARENVAFAADLAAKQGATVLIEAVNTFENGPYLLSTTRQSAEFVASVARENVKLQYDVYHMQRMEGNLVATLREHIGRIAHIQIADSPGRGEPGTGEIHYPYVFRQLEELGYTGHIGLEYKPSSGNTLASLEWLPQAARGGELPARELTVY
jgi:hydroxypyruvate isomerase